MSEESKVRDLDNYTEISKFILSFIQALLKTGYYTPGHPETSKAKEGLYNNLLSILKGRREITFVVATTKDKKDVVVDGIVDEPTTVSSFMSKGMADMFIPKFLEYFDRKNLSSFSIKASITKDEFEHFIDIMSESPLKEEEKAETIEELTIELIKNNILHVSTVFNIDLVGKDRKLPWRVEIALTRLKKDLSLIPLFKNLDEEKIAELKKIVFDDIIRPLKSPALIKDILLNLDIISSDIAGISKEEFENKTTDFIHKDYLLPVAIEVIKFFALLDESYKKLSDEAILPRLEFTKNMAKKVGLKLIAYGFLDDNLLIDYFNHKVLSIDELPENFHIKIKRQQEFEQFIKDPLKYFTILERAKSHEESENIILLLLNFLPELLARDLLHEAEEILKKVKKADFNFIHIDSMLLNEIISGMEKKIEESTKEGQVRMLDIIDLMDDISTTVLINLITHTSRLVRKISCEKLIKHGKVIIPMLKRILEKRKDWYFIRNAVMIFGEVGQGSVDITDIFNKCLNHEEPRVRVEAVAGLVNIFGSNAEKLLLNALKDTEPAVRRKAAWSLAKINSIKPEAINYFIDTITGKCGEDDSVVEQVLSGLQLYPLKLAETKQLEHAIIEMLSKGYSVLGKFTARHIMNEQIKAKACETLGYIGSQNSIVILKKIAKKDNLTTKAVALEAIEKIQQRDNQ